MPWQHLLSSVRKYRMPLILADRPEEEALVIVPLSLYENLMEGKVQELKNTGEKEIVELNKVASSKGEVGGLELEERFYLEPLDDDENIA